MEQTASTLRSMILQDIPKGICGMQVTYGSSDYLVKKENYSIHQQPERGYLFPLIINAHNPDIVILGIVFILKYMEVS